jgi:hypothetical protein
MFGLWYYFLPESIALDCQGGEPGKALKIAHWSSHFITNNNFSRNSRKRNFIWSKQRTCINCHDNFAEISQKIPTFSIF